MLRSVQIIISVKYLQVYDQYRPQPRTKVRVVRNKYNEDNTCKDQGIVCRKFPTQVQLLFSSLLCHEIKKCNTDILYITFFIILKANLFNTPENGLSRQYLLRYVYASMTAEFNNTLFKTIHFIILLQLKRAEI